MVPSLAWFRTVINTPENRVDDSNEAASKGAASKKAASKEDASKVLLSVLVFPSCRFGRYLCFLVAVLVGTCVH